MPITLKDLAEKVGKSVTTVSRALHDYDDVSPETKELVRRTADEMGYIPNIMAQRLQKQRTDTLGFILPTFGPRFSDPFFSEFLAGIGNKAAKLGYDLLVATQAPGEQELAVYRRNVQSYRVDGFIIVRTRRQDPRIEYLCESNFPFVAFGRTESPCVYPWVDEDGEYGMRLLAHHLADLGHKSIAFIAAPDHLMFAHARLMGFREGLIERGIHLDPTMVIAGDLTQRDGFRQASQLLERTNPPTAIAACNDLMALGAVSAAQKKGLIVGKDIAITGFDNIPLAEHSHPPLTTIHQPIYQIGDMVSEMLIKCVKGEDLESKSVILEPTLVIRETCGGK
ncbi:MAG: LacI family DNA-binding transcriptional regulator [Chloroflexi bacterium]|jgi:LacI family transcriptional regulator|nr:LacI family DNA-binding transcriptional regulator [Chloroflexota bacterium]